MTASTLSHAGRYDWIAESVQPVADVITKAENKVSSAMGAPKASEANADLPSITSKGHANCDSIPLPPGSTLDVGFSPEGTAEAKVVKAIREASAGKGEHSIRMAAYEFTSWPVAKALVAAKDAGVKVAVVVDAKENQKKASKVSYLVGHGIPVRMDSSIAMLHDKAIIINSDTVELGSFNYTAAAASAEHAENAVILRHAPAVAACYAVHWRKLWEQSTPVK